MKNIQPLKQLIKQLVKEAVLHVLFEDASRYVDVKELPDALRAALKSVGYAKKDVRVAPASTYNTFDAGGEGRKGFCVAVDLTTGKTKVVTGSWGGANMNALDNQVDRDDTEYPLPYNAAVIKGSKGYGPTYAYILVNPENLEKLLPSGAEDNSLSENEKKGLLIIKKMTAAGRRSEFERNELGKYGIENPILQKLLSLGFIKQTGAGILITLAGKNFAEGIKGIYV